jgi:hypothetical protein
MLATTLLDPLARRDTETPEQHARFLLYVNDSLNVQSVRSPSGAVVNKMLLGAYQEEMHTYDWAERKRQHLAKKSVLERNHVDAAAQDEYDSYNEWLKSEVEGLKTLCTKIRERLDANIDGNSYAEATHGEEGVKTNYDPTFELVRSYALLLKTAHTIEPERMGLDLLRKQRKG